MMHGQKKKQSMYVCIMFVCMYAWM